MNIFLFPLLLSALADDYYKLLGVDKNADDKTIRKSFKKLSLEFHPDRGNQNTQDHYMKLSLAYEVLTNPAKREVYDKYGEEGITVGGLKYNVEEIYDNYFGQDYPGKFQWYNLMYRGSPVIELTDQNLRAFKNRKDLWVVQFYGSRSKKSKEFTGVWNNLAKRMEGIAKVAAANCDVNEDFCRDYSVKKYPVVYIFPEDLEQEPLLYNGNKDYRSINDYVIENLPGKLENLRVENYYQFLAAEPNLAKIVLFCENKENWPVVKWAAKVLEGKVVFGEVRSGETELIKKFDVQNFPSLVAITENGFETYNGKFFKTGVKDWAEEISNRQKIVTITKELDQEAFNAGTCSSNDGNFCFIAFDPDPPMRELLNDLIQEFTNDPVSILWASSKKYPYFYQLFSSRNTIIRGKKNKYSPVDCHTSDKDCFIEAISNSLSGSRFFSPIKSKLLLTPSSDL